MTNQQTFHLDLKIPRHPEASQLFGFKGYDSLYNKVVKQLFHEGYNSNGPGMALVTPDCHQLACLSVDLSTGAPLQLLQGKWLNKRLSALIILLVDCIAVAHIRLASSLKSWRGFRETISHKYNNSELGGAMSSIVSKKYSYVVGVDTHAKKHFYALLSNLGEVIESGEIRVLEKDFHYMLSHIKDKTAGASVLFAVEGTSAYGETFTRYLIANGMYVCEVKPPRTKSRGGNGKSDPVDAEMAARSVLHLSMDRLIKPRSGDSRKILRVLLSSRSIIVKQQTMEKNALNALIRSLDLGIDARRTLNMPAIREIAASRIRDADAPHEIIARIEAKRLACSVVERERVIDANERNLAHHVSLLAPNFLSIFCVGPVTAAIVLCAYSHKGRFRSSAAFASLAGVAPIPASSGNVVRHRLSRYGDRELNQAINIIAMKRMQVDEDTRDYVAKRTEQGLSRREIRRSLKRYITRSLFKQLETMNLGG